MEQFRFADSAVTLVTIGSPYSWVKCQPIARNSAGISNLPEASMSTDDISDLIRNLLRSVSPQAVADLGPFNDEFRQLRPTPVGKSKFKQSPGEIDLALAEERKARATARRSRHMQNFHRLTSCQHESAVPGRAQKMPAVAARAS
jgi:hypothetical protein